MYVLEEVQQTLFLYAITFNMKRRFGSLLFWIVLILSALLVSLRHNHSAEAFFLGEQHLHSLQLESPRSLSRRLYCQNHSSDKNPKPPSEKNRILDLLSQTPRNIPTPSSLTTQLLSEIKTLEQTSHNLKKKNSLDAEPEILSEIGGTWELLWTTQDKTTIEANRSFASWINPLENQSYSNNPYGRSDAFLPTALQERLEKLGLVQSTAQENKDTLVRSTQSIDLQRRRVRNVVSFLIPGRKRASLTVDISFLPDDTDKRTIIVKFEACRVVVPGTPIDVKIPLGVVGPTGWLKTTYVDQDFRITRGHKGSVFLLRRTSVKNRE